MTKDKPLDKRVQRSKKALKKAFINLLNEMPIELINITNLTESAEYSRATFYTHYKNMDDFVTCILNEEIENYINSIVNVVRNNTPVVINNDTPLHEVSFFEYIYENREIYKLIFKSKFNYSTDYICNRICNEVKKQLSVEFNDDDTSTLNMDLFIYSYVNLYLAYIKYWISNDFNYSPKYMADQAAMIATKKLIKLAYKKT